MPSSDSFGTFLESRNIMRKGAQREGDVKRSTPPSEELSQSAAISLSIITDNEFPIETHTLLKNSGLSIGEFAEALDAVQRAGLVEVRRGESAEVVELTPRGLEFQQAIKQE